MFPHLQPTSLSRRAGTAIAAAAIGLSTLAGLVAARAEAATLRWASRSEIPSFDPHVLNQSVMNAVLRQAYEGLTRYDEKLVIQPALATAWTRASPTEWRFTLRPDVKFHDGTPFTAQDVVFSFERLRDAGGSMSVHTQGIREVRKIDELTVDFVLERPLPTLLRNLSEMRIMSQAWATKNGSTRAQDLKSREESYASRHVNGTGPYRIADWESEDRVEMTRNEAWWDKPEGNVDRLIYTAIRQDALRASALTDNEVDVVTDLPIDDQVKLRSHRRLRVVLGPESRTLFIGMDVGSDTLKYGPEGANPFKDVRVRKALSLAIDAQTLVTRTMKGQAMPAGTLVAPYVNGWSQDADKHPQQDLKTARSLLADAGFPDGFALTFDCPNNRYLFDEDVCKALANSWQSIGLRVQLNSMPFANYIPKLEKRDSSLWLLGWSPANFDAISTLRAVVHTPVPAGSGGIARGDGSYNIGSVSLPKVDALIDAAQVEVEPAKRTAQLQEALSTVVGEYFFIPLYHPLKGWGMQPTVSLRVLPDERLEARFITVTEGPVETRKDGASEATKDTPRNVHGDSRTQGEPKKHPGSDSPKAGGG